MIPVSGLVCAANESEAATLSDENPDFEQCIFRKRQTHRKCELNRRIEQVFLKRVDNPMLHFVIGSQSVSDRLESGRSSSYFTNCQ